MFLRNTTKSGGSNGVVALVWGGIAFIAVGALLIGLGAIGVELTSRIAFGAVLLPVVGVACLISALVTHLRR